MVIAFLSDEPVSLALTQWPQAERAFFRIVTEIGTSGWILLPSAIVCIACTALSMAPLPFFSRWTCRIWGQAGLFTLMSIGIAGIWAQILKRLIGRARPFQLEELDAFAFSPLNGNWQWHSIPSGHTTTSFALALVLTAIFGRRSAWLWFGLAALIGLSRVVVGAHFPSDVVAGAALGTLVAYLIHKSFQQRSILFSSRRRTILKTMIRLLKRSLYQLFSLR